METVPTRIRSYSDRHPLAGQCIVMSSLDDSHHPLFIKKETRIASKQPFINKERRLYS